MPRKRLSKLLSVSQVAKLTGYTVQWVYRNLDINGGPIKTEMVMDKIGIREDSLKKWIKEKP